MIYPDEDQVYQFTSVCIDHYSLLRTEVESRLDQVLKFDYRTPWEHPSGYFFPFTFLSPLTKIQRNVGRVIKRQGVGALTFYLILAQ